MKIKKNTKRVMNVKELTPFALVSYDKNVHYYFQFNPYNLAVLSDEVVMTRIFNLLNVLKSITDIEILALNKKEDFEQNKLYLKKRIEDEETVAVKELLKNDLLMLDQIQTEMAASRHFLLSVSIKKEKNIEVASYLNRIEKIFSNNGFEIQRCNQEDLMTILAVYFEQNCTSNVFDLIDGKRWIENETKILN